MLLLSNTNLYEQASNKDYNPFVAPRNVEAGEKLGEKGASYY